MACSTVHAASINFQCSARTPTCSTVSALDEGATVFDDRRSNRKKNDPNVAMSGCARLDVSVVAVLVERVRSGSRG